MSDLFWEFNEQQQAAAFATEGNLRVIAGAGSGKTKALVSRYLYLVAEYGIDPANILCMTFTNKAAGEMRRRVRAVLGDGYDTALICTYHGFCARLIRDDPQNLFLPKGGYKFPSRFLAEIGEKNFRTIGKKPTLSPVPTAPQQPAPAEKQVGEKVSRHAFGEGTILSVDEQRQTSRNGNKYLRIKGHTIVLFELSRANGTKYGWKYAFDKHFSRYQYATEEEAMRDAFDELEAELAKG